jgi:hypothetical protein
MAASSLATDVPPGWAGTTSTRYRIRICPDPPSAHSDKKDKGARYLLPEVCSAFPASSWRGASPFTKV